MNILFSLYGDLNCNSASHVDGLARELCQRGCDCVVAAPGEAAGGERFHPYPYRVVSFKKVLENPRLFADRRGPDVFHAWTPREVNRKFHARLATQVSFQTVIHLEDNEWHLVECMLGKEAAAQAAEGNLLGEYSDQLSHPLLGRRFMQQAAGFSLLIDALGELVPPHKPQVEIWPGIDRDLFYPRGQNMALRRELQLPPEMCVLTYHGNTHAANAAEVRSLYLAVALLNRSGTPTRLVRLGTDYLSRTPEYQQWAGQFSIDLGYVTDRRRVVDVLALADVYVQPGTSDAFNDYRFPSKLPEFFAMGRPVVLPRTNIGLVSRHLEDAYVLEEANGAAICDAVTHLRASPELYERLSRGAREFSAKHFCWKRSADKLLENYHAWAKQRIRIAA